MSFRFQLLVHRGVVGNDLVSGEDGVKGFPNRRLYPAEVTPNAIRAPANALSTGSNWLWNFFVVMQVYIVNISYAH